MIKRNKKIWIWVVCAVVIVGVTASAAWLLFHHGSSGRHFSKNSTRGKYADLIQPDKLYRIRQMIDGDTLIADIEGHEVTLRLIGIDTPEVVDRRKPVQCFGKEASAEGKRLLAGKDAFIERDPLKSDYDLYGRTLAYIRTADGLFYNQHMVENGFAREYTFDHEPYRYQADFVTAQEKASSSKVGLWNPAACNGRQDAI